MLIAIVSTDSLSNPSNPASLRATIDGWSFEDPSLFVDGKPIGRTPGMRNPPLYKTILEFLANGWRLLGPPIEKEYETESEPIRKFTQCEWWLTKG